MTRAEAGVRAEHEVAHGRYLAGLDPETAWGWGTPAGRRRAERRAQIISDSAHLRPGTRALEIGCGTGLFTSYFAATGADVLAVDISPDLLTLARQRPIPSSRVRFQLGRFEDLHHEEPFDAVIGSSVLHHLELETALPQLVRLLRPGGWCSFAEPNMLNPQVFLERRVPYLRKRLHVSPDETAFVRWPFARMLRAHGLEDVRIAPFDWLHPFTPSVLITSVLSVSRIVERLPGIREFAGSLAISARKPLAARGVVGTG
jgi:SAM-dependent methyltransferase